MLFRHTALLSGLLLSILCTAQWTHIPEPEVGLTDRFHFVNDQLGFIAMNGCRVMRTQDGGQTWEQVGDYDPGQIYGTFWAIDFDATGMYGVALGQSGLVFDLVALITHDGGDTWEPGPDLTDFGMQAATLEVVAPDVFLIGYIGTWSITTNNGEDWSVFDPSVFVVQFMDAQHAVSVQSAPSALSTSDDGGATWTDHDLPSNFAIDQYSFADPLHGIYVKRMNDTPDAVMTTNDGAVSFTQTLSVPTIADRIQSVSLAPDGNGIVMTSDDEVGVHVYLTSNFGATWEEHTPEDVTQGNEVQATANGVSYLVSLEGSYNYWRWTGPVGIAESGSKVAPLFNYDMQQAAVRLLTDARCTLSVMDATGRAVHTVTLTGRSPASLADLRSGVYVVTVRVGDTAQSMRVVVP